MGWDGRGWDGMRVMGWDGSDGPWSVHAVWGSLFCFHGVSVWVRSGPEGIQSGLIGV
jgi:hypothetical protein